MRDWTQCLLIFYTVTVITGCSDPGYRFTQISSEESGIDFINQLNPTADLNILTYLYYYNGAGVAVSDFNNDGFDDIYLGSNQGADKLFLNQGNLNFMDVTESANINNADGWTNGIVHIDINNDGLKDIYISKVGKYKTISGHNLLYVNQGVNENGIPVFKEEAEKYGLDVVAFSTHSAFFDYDLDGDLDMYLLCHSVYPNRSYGNGNIRSQIDTLSGDRLFENIGGHFTDVSKKAGIFQGKIGYGLGLSISDLDGNGYPDIYVGNDFFENDYLYMNQGDKTFMEKVSYDLTQLGHTSHYSMGNSIADINNDGHSDILSLDMLPQNYVTLKSSGAEDSYPVYERYMKNNYSPQFMQNTLHLNRGDGVFSEIAFISGIAATEWSWGILCQDFDLDGSKDLFITNGIYGATNDLDYINFIAQDQIQNSINLGDREKVLSLTSKVPQKHVPNYMFHNNGDNTFTDVSEKWMKDAPSFSNGSAYADLDNDGDLEIIVNNVNEPAQVFKNQTIEQAGGSFLKVSLNGSDLNKNGLGSSLKAFIGTGQISEFNSPTQSFLSSSVDYFMIGLGELSTIDSLKISWPNGQYETLYNIEANRHLKLSYNKSKPVKLREKNISSHIRNVDSLFSYQHNEHNSLDFDHDPLVPFALSHEGPDIEITDINNDGLQDLVITGPKYQKSKLFMQINDGRFLSADLDNSDDFTVNEDVVSMFFDVNSDGWDDLIIASGGNEFTSGKPLEPRLYINVGGTLTLKENSFNEIAINASSIQTIDLENDGDLDLVIASNALPRQFGRTPESLIFENLGKGEFKEVTNDVSTEFRNLGNINDMITIDIDGNGYDDLVCVGDWMPVTIFLNSKGNLNLTQIKNSEGWWNSVSVTDLDKDGLPDLVAGNWGKNSRITASIEEPLRLYKHDFDNNGQEETVLTYYFGGQEVLLATKDELVRQLPDIKKRYIEFNEFAKASIEEIIPSIRDTEVLVKEAYVLQSTIFRNRGNLSFEAFALPYTAQLSTVNDIMVNDINNDGYEDLLLVGNNYEISTQLGRMDASHGVILTNDKRGSYIESIIQGFNIAGPARDIEMINVNGKDYFIIGINNDKPVFIEKNTSNE